MSLFELDQQSNENIMTENISQYEFNKRVGFKNSVNN